MPRKKIVLLPEKVDPLPEKVDPLQVIAEGQKTIRVTRKNLQRVQEKILLDNIEPMLRESFDALRMRVRRGEKGAVEIALQVAGMIKSGNSVTVQNNILNANNNSNSDDKAEAFSFESMVRRLDARDMRTTQATDFIELTPHDDRS